MKISEIIELIQAELLTATPDLEIAVKGGFAGDLMSDVLASIQPDSVLITGLNNPQVVRTALIADVKLIVFARGKHPSVETLKLADSENLPILSSPKGLYEISGLLMSAGLPSFENQLHKSFDDGI